ncbi:uncharacterized protein N7469_000634 [Penicillium citrinum]|uniref:Uncharacterized protein n=1 Tax=Penicillium citrinum TaxID=5077 RepID=A0A9W9PE37_PENCI|nr:uncharacterized protein N7469_000634 [Penicillium citrinum]KAJ5242307.1 hypothetical protein N7469_000634 [Penicillium citrinum]
MDPRFLSSNTDLAPLIFTLLRQIQDELAEIIDRQETQQAELRALRDQQIKLLERQTRQDEDLKILQDGQAEILSRQQAHYEEVMQVLQWQNELFSTVMPQSPLSALSPSTPPGSPPLIDLSPPSEKTTKLSAGSFVWGYTKVKDKKSGYGRREGHSILAGEEAPGFRRCAQAVDVSSQTLSESLI